MKNLLLTLSILLLSGLMLHAQNVGEPAPDFTEETTDGGTFTLSDYAGKTVFMFVFGYYCSICASATDDIETEIMDVFSGNSNFVAFHPEVWGGTSADAAGFATQYGLTGIIGVDDGNFEAVYSGGNDKLWVVGKDQTILHKGVGSAITEIATVKAKIEQDLASTAVEEATTEEIAVYPNPATDVITIQTVKAGNVTATLFDNTGKEMKSTIGSQTLNLTTGDIPAGAYILRISSNEGINYKRVLIQ